MIGPKLSLLASLQNDHGASDIRLTAAERQLVMELLAHHDEVLGVDGFMFLAGGAEDRARRIRAAEEGGGS